MNDIGPQKPAPRRFSRSWVLAPLTTAAAACALTLTTFATTAAPPPAPRVWMVPGRPAAPDDRFIQVAPRGIDERFIVTARPGIDDGILIAPGRLNGRNGAPPHPIVPRPVVPNRFP